jgi:hypothetical protein
MNYKFSIGDIMCFAEKKTGIPGWKAVNWERVGNDSIVEGCVPEGVYRSGRRKGQPRFIGPKSKVVVTQAELENTASEYEGETGKCWDCHGTGRVVTGWSEPDGTRYATCSRCGGKGEAER